MKWAWLTRGTIRQIEEETVQWCNEILALKPLMALRMLKASFNLDTDGLAGLQNPLQVMTNIDVLYNR